MGILGLHLCCNIIIIVRILTLLNHQTNRSWLGQTQTLQCPLLEQIISQSLLCHNMSQNCQATLNVTNNVTINSITGSYGRSLSWGPDGKTTLSKKTSSLETLSFFLLVFCLRLWLGNTGFMMVKSFLMMISTMVSGNIQLRGDVTIGARINTENVLGIAQPLKIFLSNNSQTLAAYFERFSVHRGQ